MAKKPHGNSKKVQQARKTIKKIDRQPRGGPKHAAQHLVNHADRHTLERRLAHLDHSGEPGTERDRMYVNRALKATGTRRSLLKKGKAAITRAKSKRKK